MSTEDSAVRVATVLSAAMNVAAILHHEPALVAADPAELKSTLLWIADEMSWIVADVAGAGKSSLTLPPDAQERIDRLRLVATAWNPSGPLPSEVAICSQVCLGMLVPV
jgi:hypothetical protein